MPIPSHRPPDGERAHDARDAAESFGADAGRYDRSRPRYPQLLVDELADGLPGRAALDVGIGTGVLARALRGAGLDVLGVDPDPRMAAFARAAGGFEVEVATFERWDRRARSFDLVTAGTTWHWVDPLAGPARAAEALRPGGRLALVWNVACPEPPLARAFSAVYADVLAGTPLARMPTDPLAAYEAILGPSADRIRASGAFTEPRRLRSDREQTHTTAEWLDQVPTFGGHSRLPADRLERLLRELGAAIDAHGGRFTVTYATVAIVAERR